MPDQVPIQPIRRQPTAMPRPAQPTPYPFVGRLSVLKFRPNEQSVNYGLWGHPDGHPDIREQAELSNV